MKKLTLCVIFGGKSEEYYVSLRSAYTVLENLDKEKYDLIRLGISRDGEWYIFEGDNEEILCDNWCRGRVAPVTVDISSGGLLALGKEIHKINIDVFFPVLHGGYGEDGGIQGLFDVMGAKYVGCGALASGVCMDKEMAKDIAKVCGVRVARGYSVANAKCKMQCLRKCKIQNDKLEGKIAYPVFVKPVKAGSSVGVSRVENEDSLNKAIELALSYGDRVLIEEEIRGMEIEVGVMEIKGEVIASLVGSVKHTGCFYDYETKYKCDENEYIIPANIPENVAQSVRNAAIKLFNAFGCRSLARVDFFYTENGDIVFNEINTMPGFTEISMFPKLFMSLGYSLKDIIDNLIENA